MSRFHLTDLSSLPLAAYGIAVMCSGLAVGLLLVARGPDFSPALVLLLPVVVASAYGGRSPGLLAVLAGTLGIAFIDGTAASPSSGSTLGAQLITYLIVGLVTIWLFETLHRVSQTFQAIIQASPLPIFALDLGGKVRRWNPAAERMLGWTEREVLGKPLPTVPEEKMDEYQRLLARARQGEVLPGVEVQRQSKDGSILELSVFTAPLYDARRHLTGAVASYADITERKRVEEALRVSEERFRLTFDQAPVGTAHVDPDGHFLRVNEGLCTMLGYRREELMRARFQEVTHPDDLAPNLELFHKLMAGEVESYAFDKRFLRKDGSYVWATAWTALIRDASGEPQYTISVIEDISDRVRAEEALRHQALHDTLTGLPNRALLHDRLQQAIRLRKREQGSLALLLLDLDRFKEINDTFGHHYGDLLLQQVAERLRKALRGSDTVARLGGDEFAVLLPATDDAGAAGTAEKLLHGLDKPFELDGHNFSVSTSIGIALFPAQGEDADALLRHADVAMYMAKRAASGWALYASEQDKHSAEHLALLSDLRQALDRDQLLLHFQPKLNLRTGQVNGVEALLRWNHPEHGFISPDDFIPLAERTGLIRPLSAWVLDAALQQCHLWHQQGLDVHVSVNLSAQNLHDPQLRTTVAALLQKWEAEPSWLQVEVTESAVMIDALRAIDNLEALQAMGVTIAIDDFGTGYSSLGYLRRLPVQQIKIDRSFVKDMKANDSDRSIVCATIDLGHDLGLESVAEGVEDQHTLEVLRQSGCDQIQGYYLSRPLPAAECTDWLTEYVTRNQQESASFDGNTPASDTMPEPDAHSASGTPHS